MEENNSKFKKYAFGWVPFFLGLTGMFAFIWGIFTYLNIPTIQFKLAIQQLQSDVKINNEKIVNLKDNDIHTIQLNIDKILESQLQIQKDIVKLQVLLDAIYRKFYPIE